MANSFHKLVYYSDKILGLTGSRTQVAGIKTPSDTVTL